MPDNIENTPENQINSSPSADPSPAAAKTVPVRKPRKKPVAAAPKRIQPNVISERRLLDSKLVIPEAHPHHRIAKIILFAMLLGGLVGAAVLFYLNTKKTATPSDTYIPQITIPDENATPPATPPTTTPTTTPEPPPAAPVQIVEILSTPTNFLNVRKAPGTSSEKIGEVKPGEAYILVSKNAAGDWYEIKLANGSTGWVTSQYATIK